MSKESELIVIPLPGPEDAAPRKLSPRFKWHWHWHPPHLTPKAMRIIRIVGYSALGIFVTLAIAGGVIAYHFNLKAARYDLSLMEMREPGIQLVNAQGESLGRVFLRDRSPVSAKDYPPKLVEALIATEDSRFYQHHGVDLWGILRAATVNSLSGKVRQGGSTITQQLARQVCQLEGRTLDRKATELFVAARIEASYSKDAILERYINHIYLGSGYWGMGSAARGYFGKSLKDLNVSESALLCGIIKRPSTYSPFVDPELARSARNRTFGRMKELGYLSSAEAAKLSESPLGILPVEKRGVRPQNVMSHILEEARTRLAESTLSLDDYVVQTSVNLEVQEAAKFAVDRVLREVEKRPDYQHAVHGEGTNSQPEYLQAAVVVLDNQTGNIVAQLGSRDVTESRYDRSIGGRRPPGSAFMPFVYAAAFAQPDFSPASLAVDAPINNRSVMIGGQSGVLGEWSAERAHNVYEGEVSAAYALFRSKNAATVRIGNVAGLDKVISLAHGAGINSDLRQFPNTFLGSSEVSLMELTRAYSLFPNLGKRAAEPGLIDRITTEHDGQVVYERASTERPAVLSPLAASQVSAILSAALHAEPNAAGLKLTHAAGKTGTAYDFTDCWFVGYNARYTCGVWAGFDKPRAIYPNAFSRDIALPIWIDVMNALPRDDQPLPVAAGSKEVLICLQSGRRAGSACLNHSANPVCAIPLNAAQAAGLEFCSMHASGLPQIVQPGVATPVAPKAPVVVGPDPYGVTE